MRFTNLNTYEQAWFLSCHIDCIIITWFSCCNLCYAAAVNVWVVKLLKRSFAVILVNGDFCRLHLLMSEHRITHPPSHVIIFTTIVNKNNSFYYNFGTIKLPTLTAKNFKHKKVLLLRRHAYELVYKCIPSMSIHKLIIPQYISTF